MSFFSIPPVTQSPYAPATSSVSSSAAASTEATRSSSADGADSTDSVTVDAIGASPPAEVLDAMGTAAGTQDRLAASGRALHFDLDPSSGKMTAQLTDLEGNVLGSVSPSAVLDLTDGGSL